MLIISIYYMYDIVTDMPIGKPPRQVSENFHREKRAAPKKGELVETEDGMEGIDETSGQNVIENQCKQLICCYVF